MGKVGSRESYTVDNIANCAAGEQFLRMMIQLKHPNSRLQARWNEFVEVSLKAP